MKVQKLSQDDPAFPAPLKELHSVPGTRYYLGAAPETWLARPRVAVVGTRGITPYGRRITTEFAGALAEQGVMIVSGLAMGVDAVAHEAALGAGGPHMAIVANGLDKVYPAVNTALARQLLQEGGVIISEYPEGTPSYKQNFVARNRIVAAFADVLLITEATEKSGTLHTARFALELGREVLVVPGNITSPASVGCNNLIKAGAQPVTSVEDVLHVLGAKKIIAPARIHRGDTHDEQAILDELYRGVTDAQELLVATRISPRQFTQTLTMLELGGKIYPLGNNHWSPR